MKKHSKKMFFSLMMMVSLLILPGLFFSCDQAPLFYAISQEEAPKDPRLKGTVLLASDGTYIYAASSGSQGIHRYDTSADAWIGGIGNPGGKIRGLADGGTTPNLFALTESGGGTVRYLSGSAWTTILRGDSSGYTLTAIYGTANGTVFVGGFNGSSYAIFYATSPYTSLSLLVPDMGLLNGAVYLGSNYYLAIGNGVYVYDSGFTVVSGGNPAVAAGSDHTITGIIGLPSASPTQIAAVSSDGYLFYGSGSTFEPADKDETFTGAMGYYTDGSAKLLLLGVQGDRGTTSHGYREVELIGTGIISSTGSKRPGNSQPSTVDNEEKYNGSIGKYPVMAIRQVSTAGSGIIFAATSRYGIMSCRDRKWNFED